MCERERGSGNHGEREFHLKIHSKQGTNFLAPSLTFSHCVTATLFNTLYHSILVQIRREEERERESEVFERVESIEMSTGCRVKGSKETE